MKLIVHRLTDRQTDWQTDIVENRAAIAAKNNKHMICPTFDTKWGFQFPRASIVCKSALVIPECYQGVMQAPPEMVRCRNPKHWVSRGPSNCAIQGLPIMVLYSAPCHGAIQEPLSLSYVRAPIMCYTYRVPLYRDPPRMSCSTSQFVCRLLIRP